MRKIAALLALAVGLSLLSPGAVSARQGEEEMQTVSGTIRFITRFVSNADTVNNANGGWPGLVRRVYNLSAQSNGLIGFVFDVDPATWMGRFSLTVTSQSTPAVADQADLGIYFYSKMGDVGGQSAPVTTGAYEVRAPGGEEGFVPPGSTQGIIFMSRGLNVSFDYKAFLPMAVEIKDTGFAPAEITVKKGAFVVWENVGEQYHSVTHSAAKPAFDSSPKPNQPIIPGAKFATRFNEVGDFTYFDRFGTATGVVHVVEGPGDGPPPA